MISDVCFEAIEELDRYLNDPFYADWYGGPLCERIRKLRDELDAAPQRAGQPTLLINPRLPR